jgi:hypothetical protein
VNGASPTAIANEDFAAHYEQLRCDALGMTAGHSVGLALFLRYGMAAWVHDCSCSTPPPARDDAVPPADNISSPAAVRSQAAVILAGMILKCRPEESLCQPTCRR